MPAASTIATELANLTRESLAGVGVFDTLMRTVKIHLQDEYDAQRITGNEYATVYLGALSAVLQTSAQFVVNVQQMMLIDAQIAQINATIVNENARTANDTIRTSNETAKVAAEITAIEASTSNNTRNVDSEILLRAAQVTNDTTRTTNDTAKTNAEVIAIETRTTNETLKTSEEITASQSQTINTTNKAVAEVLLLNTQRVNDTTRATNDTTNAATSSAKVAAENEALASRTTAEVKLLNQKVATEIANVADTIPVGVGLSTGDVAGTVGSQKDLYTAQAKGFATDAEQKVLKIMADTWSAQVVAGKTVLPEKTGFGNSQILDVVNAARVGIGMTETAAP